MILKLKNANINEIIEEDVDYSVFADTFSDDEIEHRTDFTFILDDDRTIKIESFLDNYYGSSKGIASGAEYAKLVLDHLANGTYENMTIGGFIEEFVVRYIKTAAIIRVNDQEYLLVDKRGSMGDYASQAYFKSRVR